MIRGIITNNGQGIHISDGEIWMTAWEIADLFYTTAGVINSRIKAILKTNALKRYEVCQCIRLENGYSGDVYNLNMIIALSYQIDTGHSAAFRRWLINKVAHNQDNNILLYLNNGTNHSIANKLYLYTLLIICIVYPK